MSVRVEFHPHLGKLHTHVGIQPALLNGVEQSVIDVGGPLGFGGRMNIFSQAIKRGRHALAVH
jgi:hypothetical protein